MVSWLPELDASSLPQVNHQDGHKCSQHRQPEKKRVESSRERIFVTTGEIVVGADHVKIGQKKAVSSEQAAKDPKCRLHGVLFFQSDTGLRTSAQRSPSAKAAGEQSPDEARDRRIPRSRPKQKGRRLLAAGSGLGIFLLQFARPVPQVKTNESTDD